MIAIFNQLVVAIAALVSVNGLKLNNGAFNKKYKVAVIGGGPAGACAAEIVAKNPNLECILIERKMDNAKPCGGAIPVCMIDEFQLPTEIIDRKVKHNTSLHRNTEQKFFCRFVK